MSFGSTTSLLSTEEEQTLAKSIEKARQASDKLSSGQINAEQYEHICIEAKKARDYLIECNFGLVFKMSTLVGRRPGVTIEEAVHEGSLGLIAAAEQFLPNHARFSTFATYFIKQRVIRSNRLAAPISVPPNLFDDIKRVKNAIITLENNTVTDEDISDLIGMPIKKVCRVRQAIRSLAEPLRQQGSDGDLVTIVETIPDLAIEEPGKQLDATWVREQVKKLPPRESLIIEKRFGLINGDPKTLQEVGDDLGLTRERVRQIQKLALDKLAGIIEDLEV